MRSVLLAACAAVALAAANSATPARLAAGALPVMPVQTIGGGEVLLELTVGADGSVQNVTPLRTTVAFTAPLVEAVHGWQFLAAEDPTDPAVRRHVAAKVLVAGLFRPPALLDGTTLGEPPRDVAPASVDTPFPTAVIVAPYPPAAQGDGVVLIEVEIDPSGTVAAARVFRSAQPFDEPALQAARRWTFRPARVQGQRVATLAYLVFGFRQPTITVPKGVSFEVDRSLSATRR